ncbi:MAG: ribosome maturation factor RimM, partial [Acidimicrobiia bacterium]
MTILPSTDDPGRFAPGSLLLTDEAPPRPLTVRRARGHRAGLIVSFAGIADRKAAESLRGVHLTIGAAERRPLEDDEFWPEQLRGLVAVDRDGGRLGVIADVVLGEAQDRLVVTTDGGLVEVPFVAELVGEVDLLAGTVVVDAGTVNDVKVRADGAIAVVTHEGSNDSMNGITLLGLSVPGQPSVI